MHAALQLNFVSGLLCSRLVEVMVAEKRPSWWLYAQESIAALASFMALKGPFGMPAGRGCFFAATASSWLRFDVGGMQGSEPILVRVGYSRNRDRLGCCARGSLGSVCGWEMCIPFSHMLG